MPKSLQICRYAEQPERFLELLAQAECDFVDPVSFPLAATYYAEYFADLYQGDVSLIAHDKETPLVVMRGQMVGGKISDNGQGVHFFVRPGKPGEAILFELAKDLLLHTGAESIRIHDHPAGTMTPLGRALIYHKAEPQLRIVSTTDLMRSEDELRGELRKSFRSLVNWGIGALKFDYLFKDRFDAQAFEAFREFHVRTAGRETRSRESWLLQGEMIRQGRADLSLGYLDGALVSASLFLDTGSVTAYGVGVYERSLFDKPLSHAAIFLGMLRAKARGQKVFVVGDVPPAKQVNDKDFSIGLFKSGFAANLDVGIDWIYRNAAADATVRDDVAISGLSGGNTTQ